MKQYVFYPNGVCSKQIRFSLEGNIVTDVSFVGGCNGNLKAVSKLVDGKTVEYIEDTLKGNTCGFKSTSCADQLSVGLRAALDGELDPIGE